MYCLTIFSHVDLEHESLTVLHCGGVLDSDEAILKEMLRDATYVVCLLGGDCFPAKEYRKGVLPDFIRRLYPLLKDNPTVKLFVYQVSYSITTVNFP